MEQRVHKNALLSQGEDVKIKAKGGGGLEQAKKRDHKIMVTDVAISKVPYVEVPGFTAEQNQLLQQINRDVLRTAMESNYSNEVALVYNLYTAERVFVLGDENHIDTEGDLNVRMLQGRSYAFELAISHNHLSTSNFSFADIDYFIANDYFGLMSVVTNQGEVYVLLKTSSFDYDKVREVEKALMEEYSLERQEEITKEFLKRCKEGGILYVKGK